MNRLISKKNYRYTDRVNEGKVHRRINRLVGRPTDEKYLWKIDKEIATDRLIGGS